MAHIHTEPGQVDHTVTAFIVRTDGDQPRLLFHLHKKYGVLLPAGGHIELDETPWAAMAHEIKEETGYELNQLQVMQPRLRVDGLHGVINHPQPLRVNTHNAAPDHYHSDIAYLFATDQTPAHAPGEGESTDIRWLTRAELAALPDDQIFVDARQTGLVILDQFLDAWEPVPAAEFLLEKAAKR